MSVFFENQTARNGVYSTTRSRYAYYSAKLKAQPNTDELLAQYENTTNTCIYSNVHLLYYEQSSLIHVSATYCGHLQGSVL
jgi:hypothetical protein